MKLVTIKCLDVSGPDQDGDMCIKVRFGSQGLADMYVTAGDIVTVEDIPDPLPTEPGTRFWGQRGNDSQQWWYVVIGHGNSLGAEGKPNDRIGYSPTDIRAAWSDIIWQDEVRECGLVRLPDPEVTQ